MDNIPAEDGMLVNIPYGDRNITEFGTGRKIICKHCGASWQETWRAHAVNGHFNSYALCTNGHEVMFVTPSAVQEVMNNFYPSQPLSRE